MKKKTAIIRAFTPDAILKRKIRAHLRKLGFRKSSDSALLPPSSSKESIRALHFEQRKAGLKAQRKFVQRAFPELQHHFAKGSEIDPENVPTKTRCRPATSAVNKSLSAPKLCTQPERAAFKPAHIVNIDLREY